MDTGEIDERLRVREPCGQNSPPSDEAASSDRLLRRTNTTRKRVSVPRHRSGRRVAVLASFAVIVVAALAVGAFEALRFSGGDQHALVVGDEPMTATKASGLYPVRIDDKWGYIDSTGSVRVEPRFDSAYGFFEGFGLVSMGSDFGYVDMSGALVIQPQFGYACDFSGGMAVVANLDQGGNPGASGYIDHSGSLVIPMQYEYALQFSEGLAVVGAAGGGSSFIDKTGRTVLGSYDLAWGFSEGLAYVEEGSRRGFIDTNGDWVVELEAAVVDMSSFLSSVAPFPGSSTGFSEGLMALQSTSGTSHPAMGRADKGYIDKTGAWVIGPRFDHACNFSEGLAAVGVRENGLLRWGYIDKTGAWVIQPQFEYTCHFSEGMAVVGFTENDYMKFGYIDRTGAVVIPIRYWQAGDFSGGIAQVVEWSDAYSGHPTYIDKSGCVIWQGR